MKAIKRINEKEKLEKSNDVWVFLTNGVVKRSRSNFVPTTPHFFKVNVLIRFILYAIFDLIESGERPYFGLIREQIEDEENRGRYFTYLYYKIESDKEFYTKKKLTPLEVHKKAVSRCETFYQSDYQTAYCRILNHFIQIVKRKGKEGHWINYIELTSKGKELMKYYQIGCIF